jgi:hypothetical protein
MRLVPTSQNDDVPHVHYVMIPLNQSIVGLHLLLLLLLLHPPLYPLRDIEWRLLYHEELVLTLNYIGKLGTVEMISLFPRLCLLKVMSLILSSS